MAETHARRQRFAGDPWRVTETRFIPEDYKFAEGTLALSNGYLGQRASFEEGAGALDALRGNYVAGVFDAYPNATMIKLKGRPTHPLKVVNVPDHLPVLVRLNGEPLDLTRCTLESYSRTLHMDKGLLTRDVIVRTAAGVRAKVSFTRFLSRSRKHLALTRVTVTVLERDATLEFVSEIRGDVKNAGTKHIDGVTLHNDDSCNRHGLTCQTLSTGIQLAVVAAGRLTASPAPLAQQADEAQTSRRTWIVTAKQNTPVVFEKMVAMATSRDPDVASDVLAASLRFLSEGESAGFESLLKEQEQAWAKVWQDSGIEIHDASGSADLTQGLHYSLYQMIQNAPNNDWTVNIGAKGLTGEHYFGTYFWDTEAFMLPMFAFIQPDVARDLVRSRAHMLPGARRKAGEMDLRGACFPFMSDANGDEAATLWQFGLLGIHVTADVAWGVWFYYCTSGDLEFIGRHGIDIMVETSRFWASRVFFRRDLGKYAINRVLGPDEYHQGVDNNYYTNLMAQENLRKTGRLLDILRQEDPTAYATALDRLHLTPGEMAHFQEIAEAMILPYDPVAQLDLQDDRFHLLEPYDLKADPPKGSISLTWSYDRCMRTQLLRQADIVVAHVLLGDRFTDEQMRRDFDFYEPKTTHDSSLSFCSYSIAAAKLKQADLAYDYFLRTARLDLDDVHGNSWMGVHTACLAGAWQCVVLGFGGVRWFDGELSFDPLLPRQWSDFSFVLWWRGVKVKVVIHADRVELSTDGQTLKVRLGQNPITIGPTPTSFSHVSRKD
jgi:trehalose/maltose hydrolase-like predicted phosphorylase